MNCYIGFKQFELNDFWFNVLKETIKTDVLKMLQKLIQIRNDLIYLQDDDNGAPGESEV